MKQKLARILFVLLILLGSLPLMASGCEPPDPTPTLDTRPSWERSIGATETYGVEQWHAQLTALSNPSTPEP